MRAISLEISQPSVTKIRLKVIFLRSYWNPPGANELNDTPKLSYGCDVGCLCEFKIQPMLHPCHPMQYHVYNGIYFFSTNWNPNKMAFRKQYLLVRFLKRKVSILIQISLAFVHKDPIERMSTSVQVMPWHCTGVKALPEPMMTKISDAIRHH